MLHAWKTPGSFLIRRSRRRCIYDRPVARAARFPFIRVHPPEVGRPLCVGETEKKREREREHVGLLEKRERTGDLCLLIPATSSESLGAANDISTMSKCIQISTRIPIYHPTHESSFFFNDTKFLSQSYASYFDFLYIS